MSDYRRLFRPGGTYFFTAITERRVPFLTTTLARDCLHSAITECRKTRPFDLVAIVLLPDHLHCVWKLPEGDDDFPTRWAAIKARFTHAYLTAGGSECAVSESKANRRFRGVWQRRYWEHRIRYMDDLRNHLNYIHYNPVKHHHAACPHAWPYSSFNRFVGRNDYDATWLCACDGRQPKPPDFSSLPDGIE
ncbi:MAG: REP-associated tyrosine transposase [Tepidisphaerales bacterium]